MVFKLILGWAENTRQTSVAPVKIKRQLLWETAWLSFSVVRGSLRFPLTLTPLEGKMHDSLKMVLCVRERQRWAGTVQQFSHKRAFSKRFPIIFLDFLDSERGTPIEMFSHGHGIPVCYPSSGVSAVLKQNCFFKSPQWVWSTCFAFPSELNTQGMPAEGRNVLVCTCSALLREILVFMSVSLWLPGVGARSCIPAAPEQEPPSLSERGDEFLREHRGIKFLLPSTSFM